MGQLEVPISLRYWENVWFYNGIDMKDMHNVLIKNMKRLESECIN